MKVGRNDACPCGSGRKVKRCCGVDGVRRRARRVNEAATELFDLALHFPRYRPVSAEFDAWAQSAPEDFSREALGEGMGRLDHSERERITLGFQREHPELWSSVVSDFEDGPLAVEIVLAGAVVVGVSERRRPIDVEMLDLLEEDADARADPVEALALVLRSDDVWSVIESGETAEAMDRVDDDAAELVLAIAAKRWATAWHPLASEALARACEDLDSDGELTRTLLGELLLDSIPRVLLADAA